MVGIGFQAKGPKSKKKITNPNTKSNQKQPKVKFQEKKIIKKKTEN